MAAMAQVETGKGVAPEPRSPFAILEPLPFVRIAPRRAASAWRRLAVLPVLALVLGALCLLDAAPVGAAHETAPTGVSVSASQSKQLAVTWTKPASELGSRVRWRVKSPQGSWQGGGEGQRVFNTSCAATCSFTITGLRAGTTYEVQVGIRNFHDHWSSSAEGTTQGTVQSTDASLSALTAKNHTSATGTFSALALTPSTFSAATTSYTASVANSITHVKLTPTKAHTGASIKVGKGTSLSAVTSGSESTAIALDVGANAIKVEVTAEDGTTKRTYTVTVTRAGATPQVSFASTTYSVNEGASVTLTVNISPALTAASRVAVLATTPSSATPPEDYTFGGLTGRAGSRMLALPANATTATFTLSAVADGTTEGAETATWFLQKVTGEPYTVVRASEKATITIADTSTAAPASANALVSNLGQTTFTTTLAIGSNPVAQKFTTGSATAGYTLASLEIDFAAAVGTPANLRAELWSATSAGAPDSKLASLTVPSTVGAGAAAFAAPSNTSLDASTSYFVVVYSSGATTGSLRTTRTNNEDSGSASGWSIGDTRHGRSGTSWRTNTIELKIRVNGAVKGATQSTDASLSALAAKSATSATGTFSALALSPSTFSASTLAYTASVADTVTHVKLTPTKAHTGASIKVGKGTSLTAVTSGTESTAIALGAAGTDTAIKVEVTAQDGTTKRTYTVTVTRALAVPTGVTVTLIGDQKDLVTRLGH